MAFHLLLKFSVFTEVEVEVQSKCNDQQITDTNMISLIPEWKISLIVGTKFCGNNLALLASLNLFIIIIVMPGWLPHH